MKKKIGLFVFGVLVCTSLAGCKGGGGSAAAPEVSSKESSSEVKKVKEESSSSETKESEELPKTGEGDSFYFDLMIEAAQSQLPSVKEQMGDMYSDITITGGEGHTIVYTYTFTNDPGLDMDVEALKPVMVKGMKPVLDSVKGTIPDAKVQIIYLRPDQSELGNMIITQEDIDMIPEETI
ncbi:hypothetical protein [Enterococcus malodoratus]|uniref:DUF5067 domain-containing protein n=1 Tax=Enterococcus malodoratus ATCC 43197 TaxID=1158601 RepID=R2NUL8_9ENTE|nr:hypothetical protein [Enterococcus malodoratus]EOH75732.1 hypothetical protein UAI_02741 [Enterococcus malodoratus ATCC 43197]EOT67559.1 hypothetical protein I585_03080 [Enterococcus malodoratus ATCC 43197]OJG64587.1 hypothetical protein RV07_GL003963 [Enterococcus malodoratus]SPX03419.1 Uncharacterised protein [Enterococcus malodoratus]STD69189.1 Uncharacterised protein [Enterococcus malodoratus]